ncbi:MAG: hypothetical protein R3D52_14100 [Xanthobacteraceae bacterium]
MTGRERMAAVNSIAKDGQAFLRQSWNQSRQVMRLPVQLWKYSWAMIASIAAKSVSVAVSGDAENVFVVENIEVLAFSIAPMLKSDTATIMNTSRSYSRPNAFFVPAHGAL